MIANPACSHWCAQNSWDTLREKRLLKWSMDVNRNMRNTINIQRISKRCQKVSIVSECVQSLKCQNFKSMLASSQLSSSSQPFVSSSHCFHNFVNLPLKKKRCLCLNANCQSAMQGQRCPTGVVHPLTYREETACLIPVSGVGTVAFWSCFVFSDW